MTVNQFRYVLVVKSGAGEGRKTFYTIEAAHRFVQREWGVKAARVSTTRWDARLADGTEISIKRSGVHS